MNKQKVDLVENNDNFYYIKYTDSDEVKAFIGLLHESDQQILFSDITGPQFFQQPCQQKDLYFFMKIFVFDDKSKKCLHKVKQMYVQASLPYGLQWMKNLLLTN